METPCPTVIQLSNELKMIRTYGRILPVNIAVILTGGILYGIYMVLTLAAVIILWNRKGGIKSARVALGVSVVVLFLLATTDFCSGTTVTITDVQYNLVGTSFLETNAAHFQRYSKLAQMHQILFPVAFVIGDAVVAWRACALAGGKRKIVLLLVVLQVALIGAAFGWVGCFLADDMLVTYERCRPVLLATYALSFATNIAGTAVIGYTTWFHRKAIRAFLESSHQLARGEKVAVLLVESGLFYATLL
ncbi:hypothetical protein PQX77_005478, partial [Marasmius sp. AFHP31]